ncbi:FAD/NAD(P)-binding domain-containing protein [Stipitochalara longipes BDJ]|nr:FAD/NAD(P)-binding domain-containing protein [Stipitochalara longipes BDJ]
MSALSSLAATEATQAYNAEDISGVDELQVEKRYGEERAKRLRGDGIDQFVDISLSERFQKFGEDPWVDEASVKDIKTQFPNNRTQVLILGGGFAGLLYAVRMIEAGIQPEDLRIVESGGGFGGTWYYNRYPGLMCDIESYCYLPLLEETGYIPKHRYSTGEEILNYANLIADKYKITGSAVFQTKAEKLVWDEETKEWQVQLTQRRKGELPQTLNICSQFVAMVNGVLNWPKLPGLPGILDYQGEMFHTARWDYSVTGGSPTDASLTKLKDKRVAIIGTGATAVQVVPQVARWAKQLYVVQRTPSNVFRRDQRKTDPEWFKREVANAPGWQRERIRNFHQHLTIAAQPSINLVDDEWTRAVGLTAVLGYAHSERPQTAKEIPAYMRKLRDIDLPRQAAARERAARVVKDPVVAEKLQAWYPTWCKRPCFHDEYLSAFNRDNVVLVDTDGKGLDRLTANSVVIGDHKYPVDVVIFATGFRTPFTGTPAEKANLTITGPHGTMSQEWAAHGPSTFHGVLDHNFPNLFLFGVQQAANSPNYLFCVDAMAKHCAYILKEARLRTAGKPFAVAPTKAAAEDWAKQVMMRGATRGAAMMGCTPSYFNLEGAIERVPPERRVIMARSGGWGSGEDYSNYVEAWRAEGGLKGIEVRT